MTIVGIILIIIAIVGGIFAGNHFSPKEEGEEKKQEILHDSIAQKELFYSKMTKPIIVPIFEKGKATATLIVEIWLEMTSDDSVALLNKKPRLHDEFLQVFSYYSAEGKLDQTMLTPRVQAEIRRDLTRVARKLVGPKLNAVLLNSLQRQEM